MTSSHTATVTVRLAPPPSVPPAPTLASTSAPTAAAASTSTQPVVPAEEPTRKRRRQPPQRLGSSSAAGEAEPSKRARPRTRRRRMQLDGVHDALAWLAGIVTLLPAASADVACGRVVGHGNGCKVYEAAAADGTPVPDAVVKQWRLSGQAVAAAVPQRGGLLRRVKPALPAWLSTGFERARTRLFARMTDATTHVDAADAATAGKLTTRNIAWLVAPPSGTAVAAGAGAGAEEAMQLQLTRFPCDVAMAHLVTERVAPECLHWVRALGASVRGTTVGTLTLERASTVLKPQLLLMSADEVRSVVFQVLVALHAAQSRLGFKHHDLHTQNVFLWVLDGAKWGGRFASAPAPREWNGHRLGAATTHLTYELGAARFRVPTHGLLAKVGDYDQASASFGSAAQEVRVCRVDWELLDVHDDKEWGPWAASLQGARGYDIQYFVASLQSNLRGRGSKHHATLQWLAKLQARVGGSAALTTYSRPAHGRVSDVPPLDLLLDAELFGDWRVTGTGAGAGPGPGASGGDVVCAYRGS